MIAHLTRWPSLDARLDGSAVAVEWAAWFAGLRTRRRFAGEMDHQGWSPARFEPLSRCAANVVDVSALVLDYDEGTPIARAVELWGCYYGLLHTTRRHTSEAPRFRVVLPLSRAVTVAEHAQIWAWAARRTRESDAPIDAACKDPARFWYLPGTPGGDQHECVDLAGEPIDVEWLLAELEADAQAEDERRDQETPTRPARAGGASPEDRARAYLATLDPSISGAGGHRALWRAAIAIVRGFALGPDAALAMLERDFNPRCQPPWSARELAHKIRDASERSRVAVGYLLDDPRRALPQRAAPPISAPLERPDGVPDVEWHELGELVVEPLPAVDGTEAEDEPAELPTIKLGPYLGRSTDEACAALTTDADIYQRDGSLVRLVRVAACDVARERLPEGTPTIRPLSRATLRERLTRVAVFIKLDRRSDAWRPATPTDHVIDAVLDRGTWPGIRPIAGLLEAPSMRADGTILDEPGYDAATGYLYAPSEAFPRVPDEPTHVEAMVARGELMAIWSEFPWSQPEGPAVCLAMLLSILARPAIDGNVPAGLFDASTAGSGKTLVADTITMIATGRAASKMSYPDKSDELEKILGGYALRSAPIIAFDNVSTTFGGGPLDRVLTSGGQVDLRVLGKSLVPRLTWRPVVMAGGNNLALASDTTRRVLLARLEPDVERPEERQGYAHPDLLGWCRSERSRLVYLALTMLRAYHLARCPQPDGARPWGSFEAWSRLVAGAIAWAGGGDVMACRPTQHEDDPETAALRVILIHWPRLAPEGLTARDAVEALYPRERLRGEFPPDGYDELREAIEAVCPTRQGQAPSTRTLGNQLRSWRGRVVGGRSIYCLGARRGIARWIVRPGASVRMPVTEPEEEGGSGGSGGHILRATRENGRVDLDHVPFHRTTATANPPRPPDPPEPGSGSEWDD